MLESLIWLARSDAVWARSFMDYLLLDTAAETVMFDSLMDEDLCRQSAKLISSLLSVGKYRFPIDVSSFSFDLRTDEKKMVKPITINRETGSGLLTKLSTWTLKNLHLLKSNQRKKESFLIAIDCCSLMSDTFDMELYKSPAFGGAFTTLVDLHTEVRNNMELVSATLRMLLRGNAVLASISEIRELWITDRECPSYLSQGIMAAKIGRSTSLGINVTDLIGHSDWRIVESLVGIVCKNKSKVISAVNETEARCNAGKEVEKWCDVVGESFEIEGLDEVKNVCREMQNTRVVN